MSEATETLALEPADRRAQWIAAETARIEAERADAPPDQASDETRHREAVMAPLETLRLAGGQNHLLANVLHAVIHALFAGPPPLPDEKPAAQLAEERADGVDTQTDQKFYETFVHAPLNDPNKDIGTVDEQIAKVDPPPPPREYPAGADPASTLA